jgi:DNA-binding response OmpR family regulator
MKALSVVKMTTKTILVIHNEQNTGDIIQLCLTDFAGWKVQLANSLLEGVEQVKLYPVDAIILDICLCENEVFLMAKKLRIKPETESIPILLPTMRSTWFDWQLLQQYQVQIIVVNPFDLRQIPVKIAKVLGWDSEQLSVTSFYSLQ